jgi:type VI secretion system secreted protein Hcp
MKRNSFKGLFTTGVVATSLLLGTSTFAAVDMFLKIPGIPGESIDDKHKGAIDVLAWSWGGSSGEATTGRGRLPTACVQDLTVTKYIDSATAGLIMNTVTGKPEPTATLIVRKAGAKVSGEYLILTMKNVTVSSYSTGGSGGEDRLTETVTLHFDSLEGKYFRQKEDGSLDPDPITWEVSGGRGCP